MWRDIGLGDWLFDFDKNGDTSRFPAAVLEMLTNTEKSRRLVTDARAFVQKRQAETMAVVKAAALAPA